MYYIFLRIVYIYIYTLTSYVWLNLGWWQRTRRLCLKRVCRIRSRKILNCVRLLCMRFPHLHAIVLYFFCVNKLCIFLCLILHPHLRRKHYTSRFLPSALTREQIAKSSNWNCRAFVYEDSVLRMRYAWLLCTMAYAKHTTPSYVRYKTM